MSLNVLLSDTQRVNCNYILLSPIYLYICTKITITSRAKFPEIPASLVQLYQTTHNLKMVKIFLRYSKCTKNFLSVVFLF